MYFWRNGRDRVLGSVEGDIQDLVKITCPFNALKTTRIVLFDTLRLRTVSLRASLRLVVTTHELISVQVRGRSEARGTPRREKPHVTQPSGD